jgi:hypothetical protein
MAASSSTSTFLASFLKSVKNFQQPNSSQTDMPPSPPPKRRKRERSSSIMESSREQDVSIIWSDFSISSKDETTLSDEMNRGKLNFSTDSSQMSLLDISITSQDTSTQSTNHKLAYLNFSTFSTPGNASQDLTPISTKLSCEMKKISEMFTKCLQYSMTLKDKIPRCNEMHLKILKMSKDCVQMSSQYSQISQELGPNTTREHLEESAADYTLISQQFDETNSKILQESEIIDENANYLAEGDNFAETCMLNADEMQKFTNSNESQRLNFTVNSEANSVDINSPQEMTPDDSTITNNQNSTNYDEVEPKELNYAIESPAPDGTIPTNNDQNTTNTLQNEPNQEQLTGEVPPRSEDQANTDGENNQASKTQITRHKNSKPRVAGKILRSPKRGGKISTKNQNSKIFACELCGKSFGLKRYFTQHLKTHNEDRPKKFKCDSCPYETDFKRNLKIHKLTLH